MIVPQLFSYGLSFYIAGTGDWNNEKALKDNAVYLKNLIFESEYYIDENNPKVIELKEKLKVMFHACNNKKHLSNPAK